MRSEELYFDGNITATARDEGTHVSLEICWPHQHAGGMICRQYVMLRATKRDFRRFLSVFTRTERDDEEPSGLYREGGEDVSDRGHKGG